MVTASPPVSPSVVARILMIQKRSVTCGTFATRSDFFRPFLVLHYPALPQITEAGGGKLAQSATIALKSTQI